MASPQTSNGYMKIATELAAKFPKLQLSGYEWRVLWAIMRQTYGWNRTEAELSLTKLCELTGLERSSCIKARNKLIKKNVLSGEIATTLGNISVTYSIQKDYEKWAGGSGEIATGGENATRSSGDTATTSSGDTATTLYIKDKLKTIKDKQRECFDLIWSEYPRKLGKQDAQRHFNASVKSAKSWALIQHALVNYKKYLEDHDTDPRYIKHGSSWFNRWKDWVDYDSESQGKS